uniref:Uncharacterized protein n=1 Tax=Tetranychus urticae TaxID=32264 RepID=T1KQC1_TETUR
MYENLCSSSRLNTELISDYLSLY